MQQILDAILAGDTSGEEFAAPGRARVLPRRHGAQGRGRHVRGPGEPTRTRASRCTSTRCRPPSSGPGEALVAVMASAINYNTVWTSHLRAGVDVRLPRALRAALARWPSATTCPTTWSAPTSPASCCGPAPACTRGSPGDEVVAHCLSRRAGGPRRPQRHDARPRAADLGLRDQLRRARRARAGQVQPADAQARAPDLGGGRLPGAGQLHRVPPAGLPQRRRHEAGRHRADLGRLAAGSAATPRSSPSTAARPRSAWSPARRRPSSAARWAPS